MEPNLKEELSLPLQSWSARGARARERERETFVLAAIEGDRERKLTAQNSPSSWTSSLIGGSKRRY
jgi:hypothetical protein